METSTILILLIILVIIISISFFIDEPSYKLAYFLIVGLGFLCILNIYLTIFYYIKLRNTEGTRGAMGPKGYKGPRGESGKCTFSAKCGIDNPRDKILTVATNLYNIPKTCLNKPNINNCDNEDTLAQAITIEKQINLLENMAEKTMMAETDFIDKLEICLSDPNACID